MWQAELLNTILGSFSSGVAPVTSSYESIATVTVGSGGSSSIDFTSIPSTYTHLQIRYICLATNGGATDGYMRFNSDTGSNYSYHAMYAGGASVSATSGTSSTYVYLLNGLGNGAYTSSFNAGIIDILEYKNTNIYKTVRMLNGFDTNNATTSVNNETICFSSGNWRNTNAITSITFTASTGNFKEYSQFALYGIKGS